MEFIFGNSIINSYKRLSYKPWYAFAEFVDNSTQAYFNNKEKLDEAFDKESDTLTVRINYEPENDKIIIKDNSIGMNEEELQKALTLGLPPTNSLQRSKYGLGMKTAAFWFGDKWKISSTKLGDSKAHQITIDINNIVGRKPGEPVVLDHEIIEDDEIIQQHFTIIEIWDLNRKLQGPTLGKIKDYLRSMYRFDFSSYGLKLYWQDKPLEWEGFENKLYITIDGEPFKQEFDFTLDNGKRVKGWVGVFKKGSGGRKNAGFSIIKSNRVIEGWPRGFKPNSIFGDLDDGVNDLVNQRVVGELFLDDFEVSHTKDSIIWLDGEYEEIDEKLGEVCAEAVHLAKTARFNKEESVDLYPIIKNEAITAFESEIKSKELKDFLTTVQPPDEIIIEKAFKQYREKASEGRDPDIHVEIGVGQSSIDVKVFFVENSEFEPYVAIETSAEENTVIIIINAAHPHYLEMTNSETLLNFIRHCVYDGVAEWKAIKLVGDIQPYTIKNLKDGLLRIPFNIKQNKFR